jgi:uncharacterized membrane-anchored protein
MNVMQYVHDHEKQLRRYGLMVFAVILFVVPGYMIYREERIIRTGTTYRFRVAPVDPVDPFRGRYVDLRFAAEEFSEVDYPTAYSEEERVYAEVQQGEDGYAKIVGLHRTPPSEADYVKARIGFVREDAVWLDLPFDRLYMNEEYAKKANDLVRRNAREDDQPVWAKVTIREGEASLEEVFIGDTPIRVYISESGEDAGSN